MDKQKNDHVDSRDRQENSPGEDFDLHGSGIDDLTDDEEDETDLEETETDEDENEGVGDGKIGRSSQSELDDK